MLVHLRVVFSNIITDPFVERLCLGCTPLNTPKFSQHYIFSAPKFESEMSDELASGWHEFFCSNCNRFIFTLDVDFEDLECECPFIYEEYISVGYADKWQSVVINY